MTEKHFIHDHSIVRKIWGATDITLFIFAGASAEFALNKSVDWLYFTGKLPADPIGRLFSTVKYAHRIIFNNSTRAYSAIDQIRDIHKGVEESRAARIPDAAYHDVLYMLIYYSIAAFELIDRKLLPEEKDEVVRVFREVGTGMHLEDIPGNYKDWSEKYFRELPARLVNSDYTVDLFKRYRKHLGIFRYFLLLEVQRMLVPATVTHKLSLGRPRVAHGFLPLYRMIRRTGFCSRLIRIMVPSRFREDLTEMNQIQKRYLDSPAY